MLQYIDGVHYSVDTLQEVIDALEECRKRKTRCRIHYGNPETGRDHNQEENILGYIGSTDGKFAIKRVILLPTINAKNGPFIPTESIVKVRFAKGQHGKTLYQHPQYYSGNWSYRPSEHQDYKFEVMVDGLVMARFDDERKTRKYIEFMS